MRALIVLAMLAMPAAASQWTVVGEVLDGDSGAPLVGVEVRLMVPGAVRTTSTTDAGGSFKLETETNADCLSVTVPEWGPYASATVPMVCDGQGLSITLHRKPFSVEGRATDRATGRSIPYIQVRLGSGDGTLAKARADVSGSYSFELPAGAISSSAEFEKFVSELWVSADSPDYLPHVERKLTPTLGAPKIIRADLDLMPQRGLIRVECAEALSRTPVRNVRLRMGGRLGQGWTEATSDAGGAVVFEVPVWERPDVPFEGNHLRSDYFIDCIDTRYDWVKAQALMVPPGVSETPGLVVALSLLELQAASTPDQFSEGISFERHSTYSVLRLDPRSEESATPPEPASQLEAEIEALRARLAELEEMLAGPRPNVVVAVPADG